MVDVTTIIARAQASEIGRVALDLRRDAARYRALDYDRDTNAKVAARLAADAEELEAYLLRERDTATA